MEMPHLKTIQNVQKHTMRAECKVLNVKTGPEGLRLW